LYICGLKKRFALLYPIKTTLYFFLNNFIKAPAFLILIFLFFLHEQKSALTIPYKHFYSCYIDQPLDTIIVNGKRYQNKEQAFRVAARHYKNEVFEEAFAIFKELTDKLPNHANINYLTGVSAINSAYFQEQAKEFLIKATDSVSNNYRLGYSNLSAPVDVFYLLGELYQKESDYENAIINYSKFLTYVPKGDYPGIVSDVNNRLSSCQIALTDSTAFISDTSIIKFNSIPTSHYLPDLKHINSSFNEHNLVFLADSSAMLSSSFPTENTDPNLPKSFYTSSVFYVPKAESGWEKPTLFDNFSSIAEEIFSCVSPDEKYAIVASDMSGSFNLYHAYKDQKGNWQKPKKMKINKRRNDISAFIAADEKTLFFVSDRKGGYGGKDIYYAEKIGDDWGKWSEPVNIGKNINTSSDEESPWLTKDGNTLFFSSKGHKSMGGYDVFYSHKTDSGWSAPQNAGTNINTSFDELYFRKFFNEELVVYSSNRPLGTGGFDIFFASELDIDITEPVEEVPDTIDDHEDLLVDLIEPPYINEVVAVKQDSFVLKGRILSMHKKPVSALVEFFDPKTEEVIASTRSDAKTGDYSITLSDIKSYGIMVEAEDYLFWSENLDISDDIKKNNIRFETELNPKVMRIKPIRNIAFQGKTDDLDFYTIDGKVINEAKQAVGALVQIIDPFTELVVAKLTTDYYKGDYTISLRKRKIYKISIQADGHKYYSTTFNPEQFVKSGQEVFTTIIRQIPVVAGNVMLDDHTMELSEHDVVLAETKKQEAIASEFTSEGHAKANDIVSHPKPSKETSSSLLLIILIGALWLGILFLLYLLFFKRRKKVE